MFCQFERTQQKMLVVSNMFHFHPEILGKWSNLTSICFKGWFNHQPDGHFWHPTAAGGGRSGKGRSIAKWSGSLFDPFRTKQFHGVAWLKKISLRLHGMSWGVKTTCFKAPGVSLGGSGVSIGGVRILREGTISWEHVQTEMKVTIQSNM